MFGLKKLKNQVADLEEFVEGAAIVIDGYFGKNNGEDAKYSTDGAIDKFYFFVESVDKRIKALETAGKEKDKSIETLKAEVESKDREIGDLNKKVFALNEEIQADNEELAHKDEVIEEKDALLKAQEKEIKKLAEERAVAQTQLIAKNRETSRKSKKK